MTRMRKKYHGPDDLPEIVPVFPLPAILLLPRTQLPLNVFEPRYIAMVDAALAGNRIIGMVQPRFDGDGEPDLEGSPPLCPVGCLGRIITFAETRDGRYLTTLTGISRFRLIEEIETDTPFRQFRIDAREFADDFMPGIGEDDVDRDGLIGAFQAYLDKTEMDADWKTVERASNEVLVNTLSMLSPYGPAEKQALLEAPDLATRASTLIAVTELALAQAESEAKSVLQ